jgi:hypothetical protein
MGKFTKTLVAAAMAGLVASPAQAVGYLSKEGVFKITASRCDTLKEAVPLVAVELEGFFPTNLGFWDSNFFFGEPSEEFEGLGPYIAAKPGKALTMGMDAEGYVLMEAFIGDYLFGFNVGKDRNFCKANIDGEGIDFLSDTTVITKFQTKISKNLEKAKTTLTATSSYFDVLDAKDREIKLVMKSKTMVLVAVD